MVDHKDSLITTKMREAFLEYVLEVGRKGTRCLHLFKAVAVDVEACSCSALKINLERFADDALIEALMGVAC